MAWSWGVSIGFTLRQLSPKGRFERDGYIEAVTRATLLADLIFAGRLRLTDDDVLVELEATGFAPADVLLEAIAAYPGWALDSWIGAGPPVQHVLIDELCRLGAITRLPGLRRRYVLGSESSAQATGDERVELHTSDTTAQAATIEAMCRISSGSRYINPLRDDIAACGPAAWLVESTDEFIDRSREIDAWAEAARSTGSGGV